MVSSWNILHYKNVPPPPGQIPGYAHVLIVICPELEGIVIEDFKLHLK